MRRIQVERNYVRKANGNEIKESSKGKKGKEMKKGKK